MRDEKKPRYRTYTEEFKLEALELLKSSGKTARQIERDLGVTPGLLVRWRDRYQVISKETEQAHLALSDAEGWLYLAIILDLFSRKVVGWAMSAQMNTALVETALHTLAPHASAGVALQTRQPDASLLHHSDQGSQYTSADYLSTLANMNIQLSMSRVGNSYDNAVAESFFGTLKAECVMNQFATHTFACTTIFEYIEVWYNRQRLHSTLGYLSPLEFEQQYGH